MKSDPKDVRVLKIQIDIQLLRMQFIIKQSSGSNWVSTAIFAISNSTWRNPVFFFFWQSSPCQIGGWAVWTLRRNSSPKDHRGSRPRPDCASLTSLVVAVLLLAFKSLGEYSVLKYYIQNVFMSFERCKIRMIEFSKKRGAALPSRDCLPSVDKWGALDLREGKWFASSKT